MRLTSSLQIESAALDGSASTSLVINVQRTGSANIQVTSSDALKGTLKLQSMNEEAGVGNDIDGATYAFDATAAPDSAQFSLQFGFGYPFVKLVWTKTSGTGTFKVTCNRKS